MQPKFYDWSVIDPPISLIVMGIGILALGYLVWSPSVLWWRRQLPIGVLVGTLVGVAVKIGVDRVWQPFPDGFSILATVWIGVFGFAATLAVFRGGRPRQVLAGLVAVLLVGALGGARINEHFGALPTIRAVLGADLKSQVGFDRVPGYSTLVAAPAGQPLASVWTAPVDLPNHGITTEVAIPGVVSGFHARNALIYLPPAYLTTVRAQLPVLVLTSGQPGSPRDWFDGGDVEGTMDAYAAAHDGLASIVVSVDSLGGTLKNPLCLDSPAGNSFSYLTVDVPAWIKQNLVVDPDPAHWTIGGFSAGGTCSLQVAVNAPGIYPNFLDVAGDEILNASTQAKTLQQFFGGDEAAFERVNPMDLLAREQFPGTSGRIVAGDRDGYRRAAQDVLAATERAGMQMSYLELPGDHSWSVWRPALVQSMDWVAARSNLQ